MYTYAKDAREYLKKYRKGLIIPKDRQSEYRESILKLLSDGYRDNRQQGRQCKECRKICIGYECADYTLGINEVFAMHQTRESGIINWIPRCIECHSTHHKKYDIATTEKNFIKALCPTLKRHMDGTSKDRKNMVTFIRSKCSDRCQCCGILLIFLSKSGWRQASITDMYPNMRENDPVAPINELVFVCLACQWFQHNLPWESMLVAIKSIATCNIFTKNDAPFSEDELRWINRCNTSASRMHLQCHQSIKNPISMRDGRHCVITNHELMFESGHWNTASFDRDDSSLPYTVEQTHLVCKNINFVKSGSITRSELGFWLSHLRLVYILYKTHSAIIDDTFTHALFE